MSDLYCDDCGGRLRWRLLPRGNEATICPSCHNDYEADTASPENHGEVKHLIRSIEPEKTRTFTAFSCPNCRSGPSKLEKVTAKTNYCTECETSYPIYD